MLIDTMLGLVYADMNMTPIGHSDSDGDSALSPISATELDHPHVYADKPILTSKSKR
jgi:hypothetical protein